MADDAKCLVRATEHLTDAESFRHPLNPKSLTHQRRLSQFCGLSRIGVSHVRIPPGHESFVYHTHELEEEFLFVLSGRGIAEIGESEFEVGPGDFMGFPTPSLGHHLRNPFGEDLVYLMGGERRAVEIADFPRHERRMYRNGTRVEVVDFEHIRRVTP
jgi:uncharacterized cupin superfamily protein